MRIRASTLGLLVIATGSVNAAEWQLGASVDTGVQYTRTVSDSDEDASRSDLTITPSLTAVRDARRLDLAFRTDLRYAQALDDGDSRFEPGVGLSVNGDVIERRLKLTLDAASRFRRTSRLALNDADTALDSDRRSVNRVDTLSVGPTLVTTIADRVLLNAGYRFGLTSSDTSLGDTQSHAAALDLRNRFGERGQYGLIGSFSIDTAESDSDLRASSGLGTIGILGKVSERLDLIAEVGRGRVRVDADAVEDGIDQQATVYGIGAAWRPRANVRVDAQWLERSFGGSPAVGLTIDGRTSAVRIGWVRNLALEQRIDPLDTVPEQVVPADLDDGGTNDSPDNGSAALDSDVGNAFALFARDLASVQERYSMEFQRSGQYTDLALRLEHVRDEGIAGDDTVSGSSITGSLNRQVGRRSSIGFTARHAIEDAGDRGSNLLDTDVQAVSEDSGQRRTTSAALSLTVRLR